MERFCPECNGIVVGRADKKFCSDQCRTSFNNKNENPRLNPVKNINRILIENRQILQSVLGQRKEVEISRISLVSRGYESYFCTHYFPVEDGRKLMGCYDLLIEKTSETHWKIKRME